MGSFSYIPGGMSERDFDTALIRQIFQSAGKLVKNPAYYYANIPTYPGGGIGFLYVSDVPWKNGLNTHLPPGKNNYINPDIYKGAFAPPEFFREELYG
jgi:spermidine synthase